MIVGVLLDLLLEPTDFGTWVSVEVAKGEVKEELDTSLFPTVDSVRIASSFASGTRNSSGVTTSMYAHAGTAVAESI